VEFEEFYQWFVSEADSQKKSKYKGTVGFLHTKIKEVKNVIGYINPNYIPSDVANFIKKVTIKLILNWERLVSFDEWIKIVPVEVRPFSLFEVRIYSCLDG